MIASAKTHLAKWVAGIGTALICLITLFSAYTLHSIEGITSGHNAEIRDTLALERQANNHHNSTLIYLAALCDETPGCPAQLARLQHEAKTQK